MKIFILLAALLLSVSAEHRYRDYDYGHHHHHDDDDYHHHDDDDHHHKRTFTVIQFVAHPSGVVENSEVNGVGDLGVYTTELFDVKDKERVGNQNRFCIQNVKKDRWLCNWEITFHGNEDNRIYLQGSVWNEAKKISRIAVVGGTGIYGGARGSGTVFSESNYGVIENRDYYKLEFTTQEDKEQEKVGVNKPTKFNANHATDYSDANSKKVKVVVDDDDHKNDDDDHHVYHNDDDDHKDDDDKHKDNDDKHKDNDDKHKDNDDNHHTHHAHHNDDDDHKDDDDNHHHHHKYDDY